MTKKKEKVLFRYTDSICFLHRHPHPITILEPLRINNSRIIGRRPRIRPQPIKPHIIQRKSIFIKRIAVHPVKMHRISNEICARSDEIY